MSEEGGDDSPPRPKRKIKKVVLLSSTSDSDSDSSVGVAGTRRKRLRVVSDEEGANSSGSSVVCPGTRRRTLPKLRDSDTESDSSGWGTDRSQPGMAAVSTAKINSGFASDSSEGNSDKCSICLLRFTIQEVGTPENCEHIFCLDCITEWSRNVNTCPVDRLTFNSIVVKTCAGGRVLRTEAVKVVQRRSSVEALVVEDPTTCEICHSIENEETMLLCDGCDLGFHMHCLNPPLTEVPADQWLCPNCYVDIDNDEELLDAINLSEVEDLFNGIVELDLPVGPRSVSLRQPRNVRRSSRIVGSNEQPSTSSSNRSNNVNELPTTSRGTRRTQRTTPQSNRRRTTTRRRKYKRRRTKTVIIEYEVQENGKFPITKKITRRVKKRRVKKRQPRTAARRSYVRASVQAKLATERSQRQNLAQTANATLGVKNLSLRRQRAGIPTLSLMGNPNELDFFSDEDNAVSEEASTAVAVRPTSNILSAYRQARRKIVSIPSPTHASSAPDLLSNILESQTLLHSKNSLVSITVDGNINIKLQTQKQNQQKKNVSEAKKDDKIDLTNVKANESAKCVPSYPGQGRGGGWGGGYRGGYQRDQHQNNNGFNRGGNHNYGGGYQGRPGGHGGYQHGNMRRDDPDYYDAFPRRQPMFTNSDESYFDRSRRPSMDSGRGGGAYGGHQRLDGGRYSAGPAWPSAGHPTGTTGGPPVGPPPHSRHSFGGFEDPVDMRMGQMPQPNLNSDMFSGVAPRQEKPQPQIYQPHQESHTYRPSPEPQPQAFDFQKASEIEKSEDEKSDPGLVIDTEKYDPTEPTHDDDSGDEDKVVSSLPPALPAPTSDSVPTDAPSAPLPSLPPLPPHIPEPPPAQCVESILAGIDTSAMNVPPNILDTAVRQVLKEHRNFIMSPRMTDPDGSDDDSDGDCPNFSIYSATSVHIANYTSILPDELPQEQPQDGLEDLVQEDDDTPPATSPVPMPEAEEKRKDITSNQFNKFHYSVTESIEKKKSEEEYKEKVSKRCPITTNTRNPIKIKLHTPSLIKRQVSLYDDEEMSQDAVVDEKLEPSESSDSRSSIKTTSAKKVLIDSPTSKNKELSPSEEDVKLTDKVQEINMNSKRNSRSVEENISALLEEDNKVSGNENTEDLKDYKVSNEIKTSVIETEAENSFKNIDESVKDSDEKSDSEMNSDHKIDNFSDKELSLDSQKNQHEQKEDENVEKMTESISETEDERSYTPCLDENKSNKDASFENERDKGLEGLDTEMISEEEGNDMFSENERAPSQTSRASPVCTRSDDVEVFDKKRDLKKTLSREDNTKKKKKKESKKDSKDKSKNKKKTEITFKKLSKSGKERNYRERDRDKEEKKVVRERRDSGDGEARRRRKEKRKDMERYDVRSLVTEKRRKLTKDPFGRDVSPRDRSPSLSPAERSPSPSGPRRTPSRAQRSVSPPANRALRSLSRARRSPSRARRSHSRVRGSPPAKSRRSHSRPRRSFSRNRRSASRPKGSPARMKRSISRGRRSPTPPRRTPSRSRRSPVVRKSPMRRGSVIRGRTASRGRPSPVRCRPSPARARRSAPRRSATPRAPSRRRSPVRRKRRRSASRLARRRSVSASPPRRAIKKKKRARSSRRAPAASPERKRRRSTSAGARPEPVLAPPSPVSRPPSPRTPPPEPAVSPLPLHAEEAAERPERRRRDPERPRRRVRDAPGPSKEVFTSGDNILVSVSFKEQERSEEGERRRRRETRRERRRRRRTAVAPELEVVKPVAIIDLERSPFRELTPSPKNVIVLSDSDQGEREAAEQGTQGVEAADEPPPPGPKTPPEPEVPEPAADAAPERERTPPAAEPHSPDAYDPFEPTRSASASPSGASPGSPASPPSRESPAPATSPSPPRTLITLEAAQRSNLSADEVLDRRPLSPVEKVLALLQSTRDASPEPPPGAPEPPPAPRIVLPSPTRVPAKLFPGKPSPIKSNPVKPMQATRLPRPPPPALASDGGASPYSPGSSDFGELFEPPARRSRVPGKLDRKKGKAQIGVRIDDENLKILDDLPSSAVEMQVKSKFLKKLNRQERVVEEVKLVLKPHYNKKRVTKDEYKDILRRAVPKICHNKSGEINPTKIQALVEAYVKKFRKKHKLGVS